MSSWAVHVLGGLMVVLVACDRPSPPVVVQPASAPDPPAIENETGRLYLRLERGTLLRDRPADGAETVLVLDDRAGMRVADRDGDWYQVRRARPPAVGWLRLTPTEAQRRALYISQTSGPRPAVAAEAVLLDDARTQLGPTARDVRCGPYGLLTDVADGAVVRACGRIAGSLDDWVARRYGLRPVGAPAATIILFARRDDFRAFTQRRGTYQAGYAAHARAAEGYLVAFVQDQPIGELIQTLAHEMTHLVLRRTLGSDLPRWLSEGLADGAGDCATVDGLTAPLGSRGVEGDLQRLRHGRRGGQVRTLADLVDGDDEAFDRGVVAYDYELAAAFVRWLLLDDERQAGLQRYLRRGVDTGDWSAAALVEAFDRTWADIESAFTAWARSA